MTRPVGNGILHSSQIKDLYFVIICLELILLNTHTHTHKQDQNRIVNKKLRIISYNKYHEFNVTSRVRYNDNCDSVITTGNVHVVLDA